MIVKRGDMFYADLSPVIAAAITVGLYLFPKSFWIIKNRK